MRTSLSQFVLEKGTNHRLLSHFHEIGEGSLMIKSGTQEGSNKPRRFALKTYFTHENVAFHSKTTIKIKKIVARITLQN